MLEALGDAHWAFYREALGVSVKPAAAEKALDKETPTR